MLATEYDAQILQKYADDLYARARWVVFKFTLGTGLLTFVASVVLFQKIGTGSDSAGPAVVLAAIGAVFGFVAGRSRVFSLKLEAQKILCQRQIELNIRAVSASRAMTAALGK